ncbi:MAG: type I restriction enzyme HsdR N-terminal domain-containing protein [Cytophagales bacterium]|nr:type I restriction enzyme HsdR N-terminal domain-containing protein [Cytophagales bacterium]
MTSKRPQIETAADIKELLLYSKAPAPLSPEQTAELERISKYDVSTYSEEDVRAEIIDPVIRVLGYAKETYFSTQREKHLKVADGDLFIDYRMTLWSQAFWVIEAKKVKRKPLKFTSAELQQALLYAAHPEIDAALIVLCDGRVFEVYDRDESVTQPAARVEVKKLPEQFQVLQTLLGPWQAWFFEKRRALRVANRVLQLEMTPSRIEEFSAAMQRRVQDARAKVYDNWRKVKPSTDEDAQRRSALEKASIRDIVATEFFSGQTALGLKVVANSLLDKAKPGAFELMYEMFPDHPRNLNDNYVAQALRTLIEFSKSGREASWMPAWLGVQQPGASLEAPIKKLIALSLTAFEAAPEFRAVLQFAACARRLSKVSIALIPTLSRLGHIRHQQVRHFFDEFDYAQFMSTPEGHNLRQLDVHAYLLTERFVHACASNQQFRGRFNLDRAHTLLNDSWNVERLLLGDGADYWRSLNGRGLGGELYLTEHNWVDYDSLGHIVLCVLKDIPEWREYTLTTHSDDLQRIAACGSCAALEILAIAQDAQLLRLPDTESAKRFFDGDVALFTALRNAYWNRKPIT